MATRLSTSRRGPRTSQSDGSRRFEPPTHLGHALASEWTKIRSVRSTGWCLAMMFTGIVVIGVLNVFVAKDTVRQGEDTLGLGISGFLIGQIPVITLGVLAVTSEYGTGMIRTTLTVSPRRTRMLTAKALVLSALVLSIGTAAMAVLAITTVLVLGPAAGRPPTAELLRTVLGGGLYLTVIALTSLSVGALVRHSAGAISTMIGLVLLPSLMGLFAPGEKIGYYLLTYAPVSISASLIGQGIDPHSNNGWQMLGVLTLITAALLGIAYPPVAKRDV